MFDTESCEGFRGTNRNIYSFKLYDRVMLNQLGKKYFEELSGPVKSG